MFKHISIENRSLDDIRENKFISRIKTIKQKDGERGEEKERGVTERETGVRF